MIEKKQVEHIAGLSRLRLTEKEIGTFGAQLDGILKYVEKLNELQTKDIPATSHVIALENVMREDAPRPSLPLEEALGNAPAKTEDLYRVPRIIE